VIFEALLGAGLVLWGFVGKNASFGRILLMPLHLLSTFALLASLALAAAWSSGFRIFQIKALLKMPVRLFFLIFGLLLVGMSGALTALSDTLFKPDFVGENLFIDFVQADHFLKALRAYHPLVAIFVTLFALHVIWKFTHVHSSSRRKKLAFFITIFFIVQMICGFFNIVLLVPVEMQILHLFFANIIWVFCILFCSEVLSEEQPFEKSLRCG
jgi:heme A synthase